MELVVDDDEVIRRLSGRRTCRGCGKIWHVEFDARPPRRRSATAAAGGSSNGTTTRPRPSPIGRVTGYALGNTAPLVEYFGAQGKLVGIDATGPVEDVTVRAIDALRSYGG